MTALDDFLLARIAEDETDARDASWRSAEWDVAERPARWGEDPNETVLAAGKPLAELSGGGCALAADHIARWDPARVLAECEAKRRIVAYADTMTQLDRDPARTRTGDAWVILRALALPYADHPDYREEWKP